MNIEFENEKEKKRMGSDWVLIQSMSEWRLLSKYRRIVMLFSIRSVWASEKSPKLIPKSRIIGFKCQRPWSTVPPFKTIHESLGQIGSDGWVEFSRSLDCPNLRGVKKSQHRLTHLALCEFFLLQRDDKMGAGFTCPTSSQLYVCLCVYIYIYYLYIEFNRYYTNLIYNMFLL